MNKPAARLIQPHARPPAPEPASPLTQLAFSCTFAELSTLPKEGLPEVAFVGRSNAGKSSAINLLANQNKLAFVSKTPGRTQHFNFFAVPESGKAEAPPRGFLVDLPGYGFAQVGQGVKSRWGRQFSSYISLRQPLVGLVLLLDIRHGLTELDEQLLVLAITANRPLLVLLTKADKVNQSECARAVQSTERELRAMMAQVRQIEVDASPLTVLPFSVPKRTNVVAARQWVVQAMRFEDQTG